MDKNYFIKLTLGVYRVTELFLEKEPLKGKIREKADDILANLILISKENPGNKNQEIMDILEKDIAVINSFFEIAEAQNWVDYRNLLVLKREYDKISQSIEKNRDRSIFLAKKKDLSLNSLNSLNERQQKILKILEKEEKFQVWEIKKFFPEVTKRTVRRDFEHLLGQGLVERIGEKNNTFYRLVKG